MPDEPNLEQELLVTAIRERYLREGMSTEPADRPRAEAAVRRLYEIVGETPPEYDWILTPDASVALFRRISDTQSCYRAELRAALCQALWRALESSSRAIGPSSGWRGRGNVLRGELENRCSPAVNLLMLGPLLYSIWTMWWDAPWCAFYELGGVHEAYELKHRDWLRQFSELHASCFAVWAVQGHAILCERPLSVQVEQGRIVACMWRTV